METKHRNVVVPPFLYKISTFAGQILEDTFLVSNSVSGKTVREEKKSKIELIWRNGMTF